MTNRRQKKRDALVGIKTANTKVHCNEITRNNNPDEHLKQVCNQPKRKVRREKNEWKS